jgi:hypothetical protein
MLAMSPSPQKSGPACRRRRGHASTGEEPRPRRRGQDLRAILDDSGASPLGEPEAGAAGSIIIGKNLGASRTTNATPAAVSPPLDLKVSTNLISSNLSGLRSLPCFQCSIDNDLATLFFYIFNSVFQALSLEF